MTNTTSNRDLGQCIEQLIQAHLATLRASAQEAVVRAFASAASVPSGPARQGRSSRGKKRARSEIAVLGERFFEAVCAKPGETMTVLAADVGASSRDLHRSVTLLRLGGRVRAVGSRHLTRYFPMNGAASA
jgi:hypothetical protein